MTRKLVHANLFDRWRKCITFPLISLFVVMGSMLIGPINATASSLRPADAIPAQVTINAGKPIG
ncbi:MAG TPA: hypothetical protein VH593_04775, partial [Ktedonobacteraceae bacterium]